MKHTKKIAWLCLTLLCWSLCVPVSTTTKAAELGSRKDTLGSSIIETATSHDIVFITTTTIPASGKIVFALTPGQFTIPASMSESDIDVLVNGINKNLGNTPGSGAGSNLGVVVTSGTNGSVTITLNDTDPINSGSTVEIKTGNIANFQTGGIYNIINPSTIGSYLVRLTTLSPGLAILDQSGIGLATSVPVGITGSNIVETPTFTPPSGTYTSPVTVSIQSTPGTTIYYTLDASTPTTSSQVYTGPLSIATSTIINAIATASGMADSAVGTASYIINDGQTNTGGGGGGGTGGVVYTPPPGETPIEGEAGGVITSQCGNGARITLVIPPHAFEGNQFVIISCMAWSTFPIKTGAPSGEALADTIFGITIRDAFNTSSERPKIPLTATVEYTEGQSSQYSSPFTATLYNLGGTWTTLASPSAQNKNQQFTLQLQRVGPLAILATKEQQSECKTIPADLNCDGRVNLTDFSILLYYWQQKGKGIKADINKDDIVNLIDFSVMLYWWTN